MDETLRWRRWQVGLTWTIDLVLEVEALDSADAEEEALRQVREMAKKASLPPISGHIMGVDYIREVRE